MELEELKQAVGRTDPAAVLVSPRVLRRILQEEYKVPYLLVQAPHERCYFFDREVLFRHVEQDELEIEPDRLLPPTVILLARPTAERLESATADELLSRYWRLLFHCHVHMALEKRHRQGHLTLDTVRARIDQIGRTEFEEIRSVLHEEKDLLPPGDDLRTYIEFAAVYLELRYFRANLRATYFPAIRDLALIDQLLALDLDADALFAQTRLLGAPDPVVCTDTSSDESHDYYWKLLRHAERANAEGDIVRAAILHTKAARVAPAALTQHTRTLALKDLERLTLNMQEGLKLNPEDVPQWLHVLPALLDKSDQGSWPVEAKLLFDLQEVCLEYQRKTYALDLIEWILSAGKRPIKRPLNSLQLVRATQHLRSAAQRLTMARVSDDERQRLAKLIQTAMRQSEDRLRERFRPVLNDAFHDVGLVAANPPEQVALQKIIEELLDRITEYGFFTFADLRDTISRNQLKLPDLADPYSYWRGDPLLRLDRRLATLMEGVYRHGEFYLRWMESCSSLFFGTNVGRLFTENVVLPFGGAWALLKTLEIGYTHYVQPIFGPASSERVPWQTIEAATGSAAVQGLPGPAPLVVREQSFAFPWYLYLLLGIFLLALVRMPALRAFFARAGRGTFRALRLVCYEIPVWLWRRPWMQEVFKSWPFLLLYWYVLKPLAVSAALWVYLPVTSGSFLAMAATFFITALILNSRFGYAASEAVIETIVLVYSWLRFDFLRGLVRYVDAFFKKVTKTVESLLYTIDEWLRFRSDEGQLTMVIRAILAVLWFPIGYLIRLYFVTLLEPTLNPIKLPLSSLAFKFMWLIPFYQHALNPFTHETRLEPHLGWSAAVVLTFGFIIPTLWLFPGVVAFFVWEMQGNWKLFRANRPPRLRPVVVGRLGEHMLQLLKPGFHTGTIPKLFAHLRYAERNAYHSGNWRSARTYRLALREAARSVQIFIEREFIVLLKQSKTWPDPPINFAQIVLSCKRIRIQLDHALYAQEPLWLAFEEHSGWLIGSIQEPGWSRHLLPDEREVMTTALAGLYKLAGVDLIREQLTAALAPDAQGYDISDHCLVLRTPSSNGHAIRYHLAERQDWLLRPPTFDGDQDARLPALETEQLFFSQIPITWEHWVSCWQVDAAGKGHPRLLPPGVALLPSATAAASGASAPAAGAVVAQL